MYGNYDDIYVIKISNDGKPQGETIIGVEDETEEAFHLLNYEEEIYVVCWVQEVKEELKIWLKLYQIE